MNRNMHIDRTLIWFGDEEGMISQLNNYYFGMSTMLNRLLNEYYTGKKIKFINILFGTKEKYLKFPAIPMNYTHYYAGHLHYYGHIDLKEFYSIDENEQPEYIWREVHNCLKEAAISIKNKNLLEAINYAYQEGLERQLNPDYRTLEKDVVLYEQTFKASVWINFKNYEMSSKFRLEKNGVIILEQDIDKTKSGVEFFLEMYKSIESEGDEIIIKGHKDVDYLPLIIHVNKQIVL